jgi:hypothetical protein
VDREVLPSTAGGSSDARILVPVTICWAHVPSFREGYCGLCHCDMPWKASKVSAQLTQCNEGSGLAAGTTAAILHRTC